MPRDLPVMNEAVQAPVVIGNGEVPIPAPENSNTFAKVHSWIYAVLWLGGIINAVFLIISIVKTLVSAKDFGDTAIGFQIVFIIFIIANLLHLAFIYYDLFDMERDPDLYKKIYPNWFGSRREIRIRITAFMLLIAAAGKVNPLTDLATFPILKSIPDLKKWSFLFGNALLFMTLCNWDRYAIRYSYRETNDWKGQPSINGVSDAIALICWGLIIKSALANKMHWLAAFGITLVIVLYSGFMGWRLVKVIPAIRRKVVIFIRKVAIFLRTKAILFRDFVRDWRYL